MNKDQTARQKLKRLHDILRELDGVVVAFSGGVDSTFLLRVCADILGDGVVAVTATSPTYIDEEYREATGFAESLGVEHLTIESHELDVLSFRSNPPRRCYYCKKELFGQLLEIAEERGIKHVLDATNADDPSDYRPGMEAAEELGVRSPLVEADLHKDEIRELSRQMNLPTWNKPAMACLASRFPYGEEITEGKLSRVEKAEKILRKKGFRQSRVRSHGDIARIEVPAEHIDKIVAEGCRKGIAAAFKKLGFTYITVDVEGYRTGSMNEGLNATDKKDTS
jgi:uncharacterized protein